MMAMIVPTENGTLDANTLANTHQLGSEQMRNHANDTRFEIETHDPTSQLITGHYKATYAKKIFGKTSLTWRQRRSPGAKGGSNYIHTLAYIP